MSQRETVIIPGYPAGGAATGQGRGGTTASGGGYYYCQWPKNLKGYRRILPGPVDACHRRLQLEILSST